MSSALQSLQSSGGASMEQLNAGSRLCVPIALPHNQVPTYAVLELVGFASRQQQIQQERQVQQQIQQGSSASRPIVLNNNERSSSEMKSSIKDEQAIQQQHERSSKQGISRGSFQKRRTNNTGSGNSATPSPTPLVAVYSNNATTFVQADSSTFRGLVQKLTGADESCKKKMPVTKAPARSHHHRSPTSSSKRALQVLEEQGELLPKQQLRKNSSLNQIKFDALSRSNLSPKSPLTVDPFGIAPSSPSSSASSSSTSSQSVPVIEKCSFLDSPRTRPDPQLLPLFPLHSS